MPLKLYRGKGCGHCNKTGYYGRAGIYEIMEVTREHRDAMNTTRNMDAFRDISLRHGMTTLEDECIKASFKMEQQQLKNLQQYL